MRIYFSLLLDALMWPIYVLFDCLWGELVSILILILYVGVVYVIGFGSPSPLPLDFFVVYLLVTVFSFAVEVRQYRNR